MTQTDNARPAASCLVAGSINIDEFYTLPHIVRPGETISSTGFQRRSGGKGANQAVSIARASSAVRLDAAIGEDGKYLLPAFVEAGVDVSGVQIVEEHTGRAIIQLSQDGENSIVLYPGANCAWKPTPIAADITHLVVQNEIPFDSTLWYLRTAKERGVTTVYNPSPMPNDDQLRSFPWETIDWLLLNEGEAADIAKAFNKSDDSAPSIPSADTANPPVEATTALATLSSLRLLPQFSSVNLACTLGAAGVVLYTSAQGKAAGQVIYRPAARLLAPLRDTTGAGDCFAGYFVAGLMRGDDLASVIEECLTACSICVERPGAAESVPPRAQVMERLARA